MHSALAIAASAAMATPSVTIDSVAQRWPWNNKVDITYTVSGGTDMSAHEYYKINFKATVNGREYVIDGSRDIIATTLDGTHTVTWTNAPAGVKATGCTMGATMYATTGDYMIVDLDTGHMALEDMEAGDTRTATPTASNARYNTGLYKTDRLVLRRVPRTADSAYPSGYPTGYADYTAPTYTGAYTNSVTRWNTAKDYYVGVFMVTIAQYRKIVGTVTAGAAFRTYGDNVEDWCPVGAPTYNTLRNSKAATTWPSISARCAPTTRAPSPTHGTRAASTSAKTSRAGSPCASGSWSGTTSRTSPTTSRRIQAHTASSGTSHSTATAASGTMHEGSAVIEEKDIPYAKNLAGRDWGTYVDDPKADDSRAMRLITFSSNQGVRYNLRNIEFEKGAKYRIRARVRVSRSGEGSAFRAGLLDTTAGPNGTEFAGIAKRTDEVTGEYEWYDVADYNPAEHPFACFFIQSGSFPQGGKPAVKGVYLDKIEIAKVE